MKAQKIIRNTFLFAILAALVTGMNWTFYRYFNDTAASSENDSVMVNLASRQSILIQQIAKTIMQMHDALQRDRSINSLLKELSVSHQEVEATLIALSEGGTVTALDGTQFILQQAPTPETKRLVEQSRKIWDPYSRELTAFAALGEEVSLDDVRKLLRSARTKTNPFAAISTKVSAELEIWARSNADRQKNTIAFIAVIVVNALLVVAVLAFVTIRRGIKLRESTQELAEAKRQTDSILDTIEEGLLLIDRDLIIGSEQSEETANLLRKRDVSGLNFLTLLKPLISANTYAAAEEYLQLMFKSRVKEKLIKDLNPLSEVEINFSREDGTFETCYYSMQFNRVVVDKEIVQILATITDVTKRVMLSKQLEQFQEDAQNQVNLIFNIIHVPPGDLQRFIEKMAHSLDQINSSLKRDEGVGSHRATLDEIFRIAHVMKGDAGLLGLEFFETKLHQFESLITDLKATAHLSGNDFLPLTIMLEGLYSDVDSVTAMIKRLTLLRESFDDADDPTPISNVPIAEEFQSSVTMIAARIAARRNKQLDVEWNGFQPGLIPAVVKSDLHDTVIQLVRNSIVHGIEDSQERAKRGKRPTGTIQIRNWVTDDNRLKISVQDDGAGLNVDKIRNRLMETNKWSREQLAKWSTAQLVSAIFTPAFSTADQVDNDAGRGVGLDVVRAKLRSLGGKIKVSSSRGNYCAFTLDVPLGPATPDRAAA